MPRRCSVYGCRSNYATESESTSTFALPRDEGGRKLWLRHIPTDFSEVKNPFVCLKHFAESDIIRVDKVMVRGELKEYPRIIPKLSDNAIPTIFPNTPSYCSKVVPKQKRLVDVEEERVQAAIEASKISNEEYLEHDKVNCVDDVVQFLKSKNLSGRWSLFKTDQKLYVCLLRIENEIPCVCSYIIIHDDLKFNLILDKVRVPNTSITNIESISSLNVLDNIMSLIEKGEVLPTVKNKLECAVELLKSFPEYDENDYLKFIVEQISLLEIPKNRRSYGNKTMIIASCLYVHSASAYMALLKCGLMFLPHPRTLQKLICNYGLCNTMPKNCPYLENRMQHLKQHERLVSLLMDEIYIQPELSFKCGEIYGSSVFHAEKSAKTAQVFMIASVLSKYVDVVAIVPVNNITSEQLKELTSNVLVMVEKVGFEVLSLVADNNAVNRRAYELYSPNKIF